MSTELSTDTLIKLSVSERGQLISQIASNINVSHITDEDLHKAYKLAQVISQIAASYIKYQIEQDEQKNSVLKLECQADLICDKTDKFTQSFINWLKKDFETKNATINQVQNPVNLFELFGAKLLVTSNSVTRSLSTRMGQLWEDIANISPYVISPEREFGIKITGIDILILNNEKINFAQLKTSKNALTGSQIPRAKKELNLHTNSLFIAAFDVGKWTFPQHSTIPRIAGKTFWDMIYIDYNLVATNVKNMLHRIDKAFSELAASYKSN